MRRASPRSLHHPQCPWRHLLRVHQSHAGDRDARLRRHRDGFCHRMPDGQARTSRRHGPDGVPHPQRLSRRRHEGAPARGQEHGVDRVRAGRCRKSQMAAARGVQSRLVARRMAAATARSCRRHRAKPVRSRRWLRSSGPATTAHLRPRASQLCLRRRHLLAASRPPAAPSHGATRFSSVFGTRRR